MRAESMKHIVLLLLLMMPLSLAVASPSDDWYRQGSGQLLLKSYSNSEQLDSFTGIAAFISADYLERGGLAFGYHINQTQYQSGPGATPDNVDEQVLYLSGHMNQHSDALPGQLRWRLDAYVGRDSWRYDIVSGSSGMGGGGGSSHNRYTENDDVWVLNPIVSFLNYDKTLYADLGYAYSSYHSSDNAIDDIQIRQWTPTLGVGFNRAMDWLQLRAYLISLSGSNRVTATDGSSAVEAKWTHWFGPDAPLTLDNVRLTLLAGERIYAVDGDARALNTLSDMQTGLLALSGEWRLGEQGRLLLQAGYESNKNRELNDSYQSVYLYGSLSRNW
jgi:hypothetical protein